jgi:hypothetical protein
VSPSLYLFSNGITLKTKTQNLTAMIGLPALLFVFGSSFGACAPAEPAAAPADAPLTDAQIEEKVASLGPDAKPVCQEYVRVLCKQKGANLAACERYAESIRGMANNDQGTIACKGVVDSMAQQPKQPQ